VSWATEALDEVRRGVWNDARNSEKAKKDKKDGKDADKEKSKPIKNSRYALLKNPENLTAGQEANIEMIAISNPKLYRAYRLKEFLRLTLKLPESEATEAIDKWMKWAQRCRIPQFLELRKKIKRHRDAIMQTIRARITNARVEALNNKIKVTIRMGYGFRNIDNMISLLMLRCSGVKVGLPGRG
jgi:transposase